MEQLGSTDPTWKERGISTPENKTLGVLNSSQQGPGDARAPVVLPRREELIDETSRDHLDLAGEGIRGRCSGSDICGNQALVSIVFGQRLDPLETGRIRTLYELGFDGKEPAAAQGIGCPAVAW